MAPGAAGRRPAGPPVSRDALVQGLAHGEIALAYQPIVRIADRRPVSAEGLARWHRVGADAVPPPTAPDDFVPMAEREGLGPALTWAVLSRAVADLGGLARAPRPWGLPVAVNVPLESALDADLGPSLAALCRAAHVAPGRLRLELTETTPVHDVALLRRAVTRLRRAGFALAVDDMGPGDGRDGLLDLPFAAIKLDGHLVADLPRSRAARARVERLTRTAHAAGLRVTAEGIANAALWQAAAAHGADEAQGHAVGPPVRPEDLPLWAASWVASPHRRGGPGRA